MFHIRSTILFKEQLPQKHLGNSLKYRNQGPSLPLATHIEGTETEIWTSASASQDLGAHTALETSPAFFKWLQWKVGSTIKPQDCKDRSDVTRVTGPGGLQEGQ